MTNERAIELLKRISDSQFDGIHGDERREALEMAVRALVEPNIGQKTIDCIIRRLNDEERTTGDTIYRQEAIDALMEIIDRPHHAEFLYTDEICRALNGLPSAQPEVLACGSGELVQESDSLVKDLVKDCISRKAAMVVFENSGLDDDSKDTVVRVLEQLPSAQPQRKKGKWIEHNPHKWGLGIIYECSECGYEMDCEEPNFCPSCGVRMGEGE